MADYDLKSIAENTTGPSADTEVLFGAADQSTGTPKPYQFAGIKLWVKSWIAKGDVGLGNVANTKYNLTAVVDPAATDDTGSSYTIGSLWFNTLTGTLWIASDVTASAAVWQVFSTPLGVRRPGMWSLQSTVAFGATPVAIGGTWTTIGTGPASTAFAASNERTKRLRDSKDTGATSGSSAGHRSNNFFAFRSSAAGRIGFRYIARFALETLPATWRSFVGLSTTGTLPNADPSALLNSIGMGKDSADSAWQIMTNDGSGTATKVALNTTDFPITVNSVLEFELFCSQGATAFTYWVRNISGVDANGNDTYSKVITGTVSLDLPAADTAMCGHCWINNDVNNASAKLNIMKLYTETLGG